MRIWCINDVIAVWLHKEFSTTSKIKQHPSIQEEANNKITFLDVLVKWKDTTNTLMSVFRKMTHTY